MSQIRNRKLGDTLNEKYHVTGISLLILDKCKLGCAGCRASHPKRDVNRVLENFEKLLSFLHSSGVVTYECRHEIAIALETSGLLSSNKSFLLSSSFDTVLKLCCKYMKSYNIPFELDNADIIDEKTYNLLPLLHSIIDRYEVNIDIASPINRFYNGSEYKVKSIVNSKVYNSLFRYSDRVKINYLPLRLNRETDSNYYIYNNTSCDLKPVDNDEDFIVVPNRLWNLNNYVILISDQGFYIVPRALQVGKLIYSTYLGDNLDDEQILRAINNFRRKYDKTAG